MKKVLALTLLFSFVLSSAAKADIWEMAESPKYGRKAGGMLLRGIVNVASSPIDIPAGMVVGAQKYQPQIMGAVGGLATGAMCTILRAASGIIDVAMFWVPGFNGIPICRTYGDCLACNKKQEVPPMPAYMPTPEPVYQQPVVAQNATPAPASKMKYIKK